MLSFDSLMTVVVTGNVGNVKGLSELKSGSQVFNFSLAVNQSKPDGKGGYEKSTTWFDVALWGKQAETAARFIQKGAKVTVVANKLAPRTWLSNGEARCAISLTATDVYVLQKAGNSNGDSSDGAPIEPPATDEIPW